MNGIHCVWINRPITADACLSNRPYMLGLPDEARDDVVKE
jgi:hypothetical protein